MSKARDLADLGSNTADVALDSEVVLKSLVDAKGDLISATAADTPARLAVGTDGQVLTADSATATGLKWAAVSAGGKTLLSTTTISNQSSVTVTGIDQTYKDLFVLVYGITIPSGSGSACTFAFGNSSGTLQTLDMVGVRSSSGTSTMVQRSSTSIYWDIANTEDFNIGSDTNNVLGIMLYDYASANIKPLTMSSRFLTASPSISRTVAGGSCAAAAIEQFKITSGTMGAGTIKIYGVK